MAANSGRIQVAVICGGASAEHEVSLASARNIVAALDRQRFAVAVIGIDKTGAWYAVDPDDFVACADDPQHIHLKTQGRPLAVVPGQQGGHLIDSQTGETVLTIDVALPIVHGSGGEDGVLQGLLKAANIACVGSGILGSAAAMDKDITKRLLRDAGLTVAPFELIQAGDGPVDTHHLLATLGTPVFVKPANLGSSVGISRVTTGAKLAKALDLALQFDHKVLVEAGISGRELECAVLGNEQPMASTVGEVVVGGDGFYAYETKYVDDSARIVIPAELAPTVIDDIRHIALQAYQAVNCRGLARVDVFVTDEGQIIVNEINTLPGFTHISMYPKLWAASGIGYTELISRLLELALDRHRRDQALATSL